MQERARSLLAKRQLGVIVWLSSFFPSLHLTLELASAFLLFSSKYRNHPISIESICKFVSLRPTKHVTTIRLTFLRLPAARNLNICTHHITERDNKPFSCQLLVFTQLLERTISRFEKIYVTLLGHLQANHSAQLHSSISIATRQTTTRRDCWIRLTFRSRICSTQDRRFEYQHQDTSSRSSTHYWSWSSLAIFLETQKLSTSPERHIILSQPYRWPPTQRHRQSSAISSKSKKQ